MSTKISYIINKIALLFFVSGSLIIFFTFYPVLNEEIKYKLTNKSDTYEILTPETATKSAESILEFKPTTIKPVNYDFSLIIPKLGINTTVIPNIDSSNPDIYLPALHLGAAHAKNSYLPGENGPVFIFGHSTDAFYNITRYNAVFFLLNKLKSQDDIYLFYQQKLYHYQVDSKQIVNPEEISSIVKEKTKPVLILQTCHPPGTTLKRLIIISEPI